MMLTNPVPAKWIVDVETLSDPVRAGDEQVDSELLPMSDSLVGDLW
jgi:hypothetical protein